MSLSEQGLRSREAGRMPASERARARGRVSRSRSAPERELFNPLHLQLGGSAPSPLGIEGLIKQGACICITNMELLLTEPDINIPGFAKDSYRLPGQDEN